MSKKNQVPVTVPPSMFDISPNASSEDAVIKAVETALGDPFSEAGSDVVGSDGGSVSSGELPGGNSDGELVAPTADPDPAGLVGKVDNEKVKSIGFSFRHTSWGF